MTHFSWHVDPASASGNFKHCGLSHADCVLLLIDDSLVRLKYPLNTRGHQTGSIFLRMRGMRQEKKQNTCSTMETCSPCRRFNKAAFFLQQPRSCVLDLSTAPSTVSETNGNSHTVNYVHSDCCRLCTHIHKGDGVWVGSGAMCEPSTSCSDSVDFEIRCTCILTILLCETFLP